MAGDKLALFSLLAGIAVALCIGALIMVIGISDYRQRRDSIARSTKASLDVLDWLKNQPDEVKRKFLSDYDAIQAGKAGRKP